MMTAILAPLALGSAGIAIDLTRAFQTKTEMQSLADSAALAAASMLSEKDVSQAEAIERAKNLYAAQMVNYLKTGKESDTEIAAMVAAQKAALTVTVTEKANGSRGKAFTVAVSAKQDMSVNAMTGLVTGNSMKLASGSTATSASESTTGISMYLALDRSGSMAWITDTKDKNNSRCDNYTEQYWPNVAFKSPCYISKIQALKTAANAMFSSLNALDKNSNLVRVGAVSYTHNTQSPSTIGWGTSKAANYINALPQKPVDGTDANGAMTIAFNALKSEDPSEPGVRNKDTEAKIQKDKGNDDVNRYIVLMTDGKMTGNSAATNWSLDRGVRQKCADAKADGIKIFTVAFMAPQEGRNLLTECASDSSYYYEPENMEDLVKAFGEIAEKAAKATTRLTN
ncbi:Flp pilus assembly protein TadG [Neorhizobium huautlense]|uniref:Flp pilus assembly protein TadG n=1 Tax=Neorhizobium huautlense TaxID=67774 RepID=A0ABT9PNS7_9HYPH|nr:TadE/TadG family type IV pilus assembly protein [Neorhizobium huautlense]MDP9836112.1 Flp pilus assembly protein TadG [Neorhizobium huautlense]